VKWLRDIYSVWWADLCILRHLWWRFIILSLMGPFLYLVAFGYGLGRGMTMEGVSYIEFVIPGIMALTAMNTSYNAAGMKLNVDRLYNRSFDEFLMAPMGHVPLLLGKSLIGIMRGLTVAVIFMLIGFNVVGMHISVALVLVLILECIVFAQMGVLAALLARKHQDMATFTSVVVMPMSFLGGTFFSLANLPVWLQGLISILPLTHAAQCLRAEALGNPFPWLSLGILIAFGLVFFVGSITALHRYNA
jgi:ABC-2 type transport system permease protein